MSKVDEILLEELAKTRAEIQTRMITERKYVSGSISRSLKEVSLGSSWAGIEGAYYAGVLERPRKPGAIPADFMQTLTIWANTKGISSRFGSQADFSRFIYNTAMAIKRAGFNPSYVKDIFTTPFQNLANRLPLSIGDELVTQITDKVWQKL